MSTSRLATELLKLCRKQQIRIVTAESCTGGMVAAALTNIAGASEAFDRGFITYTNASKTEVLGVPAKTIEKNGAVSKKVAIAMVEGALKISPTGLAVAVTGIAGPGGGTKTKPIGLVYIAVCRRGKKPVCQRFLFADKPDRKSIRKQAVDKSLEMMIGAVRLR